MAEQGWYPDPSGQPDVERYWDGTSWSTATRPRAGAARPVGAYNPTGTYAPQQAPQLSVQQPVVAPVGDMRKKSSTPWWIGGIALLVATLVLGLLVWRPWSPRTPMVTETETTAPATWPAQTASASAGASRSAGSSASAGSSTSAGTSPSAASTAGMGPLDCSAGRNSQGQIQPTYTGWGLAVDVPGWPTRFDRTQWTWVDDVASWGTSLDRPAGITFGGIQKRNGFGPTSAAAATLYVKCLMSYGPFSDSRMTDATTEAVTVDGMPATRITALMEAATSYWVQLDVVESGQANGYGTLLSFAPQDDPSKISQVQAVAKTLRKA